VCPWNPTHTCLGPTVYRHVCGTDESPRARRRRGTLSTLSCRRGRPRRRGGRCRSSSLSAGTKMRCFSAPSLHNVAPGLYGCASDAWRLVILADRERAADLLVGPGSGAGCGRALVGDEHENRDGRGGRFLTRRDAKLAMPLARHSAHLGGEQQSDTARLARTIAAHRGVRAGRRMQRPRAEGQGQAIANDGWGGAAGARGVPDELDGRRRALGKRPQRRKRNDGHARHACQSRRESDGQRRSGVARSHRQHVSRRRPVVQTGAEPAAHALGSPFVRPARVGALVGSSLSRARWRPSKPSPAPSIENLSTFD
jgi:hypothetical protein